MHRAAKRATAGTVTLIPNRLAGRPHINPTLMEVTMVTSIMSGTAPATVRTSNREEADDYRGFVVRLNENWRVVACSAGIQWILQRHGGLRRGGARWLSIAFHRSRETLKVAVQRRCGQVDPDQAEVIDALPAWIGGAN